MKHFIAQKQSIEIQHEFDTSVVWSKIVRPKRREKNISKLLELVADELSVLQMVADYKTFNEWSSEKKKIYFAPQSPARLSSH